MKLEQVVIPLIIACIGSSALSSLITYLIDRKDRKAEKSDKTAEQIKDLAERLTKLESDTSFSRRSNHLQLKSNVKRVVSVAVDMGRISIDDKAFVLESVELLHTDGENGEMTACADAIKNLPITTEII